MDQCLARLRSQLGELSCAEAKKQLSYIELFIYTVTVYNLFRIFWFKALLLGLSSTGGTLESDGDFLSSARFKMRGLHSYC